MAGVESRDGAQRAPPMDLLSRTRDLYTREQDHEAELLCREILELHPDHLETLLMLARIANRRQRWAEALAVWRQIHALGTADLEPVLQIARAALRLDDLDEAETWFRRALAHAPYEIEALRSLAQIAEKREAWKEAAEIWQRVHALEPAETAPMLQTARCLYRGEGYVEACTWFRLVLDRNGDDAEALRSLARIAQMREEWREASELWQRLHALAPCETEPILQTARCFYRLGSYDEAGVWFGKLLAGVPDHAEAVRGLAQIAEKREAWRDAAALWQRLHGLAPAENEPVLQTARCLYRVEAYAEARSWFQSVLDRKRDDAEALLYLARIAQLREEWQEAAGLWQRLHAVAPGEEEPILQAARCFYRLGSYDEAGVWFGKLLAGVPDHAEAVRGLAQIAEKREAWRDAAALWQRLHGLAPAESGPILQTARCFYRAEAYAEARAWFQALLSREPDNAEALRCLGRIAFRNEQWGEAIGFWQRLQRLQPGDTEAIIHLARALYRLDSFAEAAAWYEKARLHPPYRVESLKCLARMALHGARWMEALKLWREVADCLPEAVEPVLQCARVERQLKQVEAASEDYRRVLALDDAHAEAWQSLALLWEETGQKEDARICWRGLCRAHPDHGEAWLRLTRLCMAEGNAPAARGTYEEARERLAGNAVGQLALGQIAECARLPKEAEAHFHRAAEMDPSSPAGHAELARFQLRQGMLGLALNSFGRAATLNPADARIAAELQSVCEHLRILDWDPDDLSRRPETAEKILLPEALFELVSRRARGRMDAAPFVPGRVVLTIPTLGMGGAEREFVVTVRGLLERHSGSITSVIALCGKLNRDEGRDHGFFLSSLLGLPLEVKSLAEPEDIGEISEWVAPADLALLSLLPARMRDRAMRLLWAIKLWRPQVVHAWLIGIEAGLAAAMAGVPRIVLSEQNVSPGRLDPSLETRDPRRLAYTAATFRALLGLPHVQLTCNSLAGARDYAAWLQIDARDISVIPNAVMPRTLRAANAAGVAQATEGVTPGSSMAAALARADGHVVGTAGRFHETKQPLLWVETAAKVAHALPRTRFVMLGEGPLLEATRARAEQLGIGDRLMLPGAVKDLASWYRVMDVLLLTSRVEGLPNALIEAQACGVPVVASRVGGSHETMWENVTGWTPRDASSEAMAAAVVRVLAAPRWHAALRRLLCASFARLRFSRSRMLAATLETYRLTAVRRSAGEPSVAAAVLFHNRAAQTIECLTSLLSSGVRIYVLDNGSDPAERGQVAAFARKHRRIVLFAAAGNLGVSAGRNLLIDRSCEDWLLFLDNDIVMQTADWLPRFRNNMRRNSDIEAFCPRLHNVHDNSFVLPYRFQFAEGLVKSGRVTNIRGLKNRVSGGASLLARSLFERLGRYDEEMFVGYEDYELAIRAVRSGAPIRALHVEDILLRHEHRRPANAAELTAAINRYNLESIAASSRHLHDKHGVRLDHDWRPWVNKQRAELGIG